MLSRLLMLLLCVATVINTYAQKAGKSVVKTTENMYGPAVDYKQPGAPMPRLKVHLFTDTASRRKMATDNGKRKKKKQQLNPQAMAADTVFLTEKDFDNGANMFIMMFNPTCGHCQDMTKHMENNIALFRKSKILLLATPVMRSYLGDFAALMRTDQYPSIQIGTDSSGFVDNTFLYQTLPQINIYDSERRLLKIYTGDTPFDSLKQYIQ